MPSSRLALALILCLASVPVGAQTWTEEGDAMSFPDRGPQTTRGPGPLTLIEGSTGPGDPRDAYCIRVEESFFFLATTDPASHSGASATFDTRLFLFDEYGKPVLANDDSPAGGTDLSTLDRTATDGSGFALEQRGKYVLVVAGAPDVPHDLAGMDLFAFGAGSSLVHAPASGAGSFSAWAGGSPPTGSYTLALEGVEFCQDRLSAVFTKSDVGAAVQNRVCVGDGGGGFSHCRNVPDSAFSSRGAALGYIDPNRHLDLIVANTDAQINRTCAGGETGFGLCVNVSTSSVMSQEVALRDLDGDTHLDAVIANFGPNKICYGDGGGLFTSCVDIFELFVDRDSPEVALGYVDDDEYVDAVFALLDAPNRVCFGDALGGLVDCAEVNSNATDTEGVALGRVNGDEYLDLVFANFAAPDGVCLGQPGGTFDCSPVDPADNGLSLGLALGYVDTDEHLDAVFARDLSEPNVICLGDGDGDFTCSEVDSELDRANAVALGMMNDDPHLDAVFGGDVDYICLGDGTGAFDCSIALTGGVPTPSTDVELGPLVNAWIFSDGLESGDTVGWSSSVP